VFPVSRIIIVNEKEEEEKRKAEASILDAVCMHMSFQSICAVGRAWSALRVFFS
jgi:NADH:ubiquinone oxidoreductase subunit F (NADH-binding)